MNMSDVEPDYRPKWHCNVCGSYNVESIENARFDPNNNYAFVEACDIHVLDWCNDCNEETTLDECEKNHKEWTDRHNIMMREPNNE
jgi:hypothetical protein